MFNLNYTFTLAHIQKNLSKRHNSAENAHLMLRPDQFLKIRQIKAWNCIINLTNPLRSYNGLQVWNHFSSRSFSDLNVIGLDANVIFQTIGMVIGGRHPGFYFLDEAETSDLVGTNTKPHYYIVGPSQIS